MKGKNGINQSREKTPHKSNRDYTEKINTNTEHVKYITNNNDLNRDNSRFDCEINVLVAPTNWIKNCGTVYQLITNISSFSEHWTSFLSGFLAMQFCKSKTIYKWSWKRVLKNIISPLILGKIALGLPQTTPLTIWLNMAGVVLLCFLFVCLTTYQDNMFFTCHMVFFFISTFLLIEDLCNNIYQVMQVHNKMCTIKKD